MHPELACFRNVAIALLEDPLDMLPARRSTVMGVPEVAEEPLGHEGTGLIGVRGFRR